MFHSRGWLEALSRTYGYGATAFTTSPPTGALENGVVFCEVPTFLVGRRIVSLPFSDHCEPLANSSEELNCLLQYLQQGRGRNHWKYVEIRPSSLGLNHGGETGFRPQRAYFLHRLDLHPSLDELFRGFHKDSIRRRIRKAENDDLVCERGQSEALLQKYYGLALLTRRRHHIPPQPIEWFRNLLACLSDDIEIHVASKAGKAVASIITLRFKKSVVYKYGCSDKAHNNLAAGPLLMWKAIKSAKESGAEEFDMGRSDCDNQGLITYKDRWGTERVTLTYWRSPAQAQLSVGESRGLKFGKFVFGRMPDSLLKIAGKLIYRYVG